MGLIQKIFGTYSQRELKSIYPIADKIEALEEEYRALTDEQLQAKTPEFKQRLQQGETLTTSCRRPLPPSGRRRGGRGPFRGGPSRGIFLHQGRIAEMKTGEGKTLVATLPAYLNALTGNGVHIVTVNDYLAKRDSEWMGKVHRFMGLTVGLIVHGLTRSSARPPMPPTSPTAPTTRWASTICGTTWPSIRMSRSSGATASPSWTRWTPS